MPDFDDISWNEVQHAYGTCEEFPVVMRALASPEANLRSWARNWLSELLFHQETHYPANEFAVPFLLEAAADPTLPERERHLAFLNRFLVQSSIPLTQMQREKRNRKLQKRLSYEFGDGVAHWRDYYRRSMRSVWHSRELLLAILVGDEQPAARCWAAYQLANLFQHGRHAGGGWIDEKPTTWFVPEEALSLLDVLRAQAEQDPDPAVRVACVFGIGFLRDEPTAALLLTEIYARSSDSSVRVAAAAALHVTEPQVPKAATALVVQGIIKNALPGLSGCHKEPFDPDHPLAVAYANLGMPLGEADAAPHTRRRRPKFHAVPFPSLSKWLNASLQSSLPLVELVEEYLPSASILGRSRAVRFLGELTSESARIDALLEQLLHGNEMATSMAAAIALRQRHCKVSHEEVVAAFVAPLRSDDARLRRLAVKGLRSMWTPGAKGPIPKALPLVVDAAKRETDPENKRQMCEFFERAAIEAGSMVEFHAQAQSLAIDWLADPALRFSALRVLNGLHAPHVQQKALEPLLKILKSDDPNRRLVPRRLACIPSERVRAALVESLCSDPDPELREAISWAVEGLSQPAKTIALLLAAYREDQLKIDGAVARILARLARVVHEDDAEVAAKLLLNAPPLDSSNDRMETASALGDLEVLPIQVSDTLLQMALDDLDGEVRSAAANALVCAKISIELILPRATQIADRNDDEAMQGLLRLLDHGNTPRMPGLAQSLLPGLKHPDDRRRQKTISALARMQAEDPAVERAVLDCLKDESLGVRGEVAKYGFCCLTAEEVCPPLLAALHDKNSKYWVWRNLLYRAPIEVLLRAADIVLRGDDDFTTGVVCGWLEEQGSLASAIVPTLQAVLDDPSPKYRFAKLKALLAIDPTQTTIALRVLEPLLQHELDAVRKEACALCERMKVEDRGDLT